MGKAVVVSFEDSAIKVVYASLKNGKVTVQDSLLLRDDQLDNFLQQEKADRFVVVNSFKDFFQEIILIPPAKDKYAKSLIEAEIRKRSIFKGFSYIHTFLGEKVSDGRRMREVFVFAVRNDEINGIVDRFVRRDKIVTAVYPDIFALASVVDHFDHPVLCVGEVGLTKTLFLVADGSVQFVRTVQAFEPGLEDLDIQNINMTVNYCSQSLKMSPEMVLITENLCSNYNATMKPAVPIACITHRYISGKGEAAHDCTVPVSALLSPSSVKINLLTREFRRFFQTRQFLSYASSVFILLSILGAGYASWKMKEVATLKERLALTRRSLPDPDRIISEYDRKSDELGRYSSYVSSLNSSASAADVQGVLVMLAGLKRDEVKFSSISIAPAESILHLELKGSLKTGGYGDAQRNYQGLIDAIGRLKGTTVTGSSLDLKSMEFFIKADCR